MTGKLTFHIERDGEFSVLTYKGGGCRPATPEEIELWEALLASTQQASTEIDELKAKLASYEREREDQNRYLAAQSAEIAGLKQRLAKQSRGEVMEKRILELADKYRIDYGGDYSRNAKEHELDLLAFVRAVLPSPTQQPCGEVTGWQPIASVVKSSAGPYLLINGQRIFSWLGTMYNDEADRIAQVINDAARTQGGES
ncbi:hypothetical protein [Burkholderia pseudomallei]|uniref:hypothetical protein n=1 Tax=Burkholderia pseudomallei TaxID=28450 RepID=UPI00052A14D8|nr:hypothetical protein [Burkholderia pseudomallei]AIV65810.1 hypothetical protein X993_5372 [Burkholderia pseudomallei K42]